MRCTRVLLQEERRVSFMWPARRRVQDIWPTSISCQHRWHDWWNTRYTTYMYNDECKMLLLSYYTRMCKSILHIFYMYCHFIPCWYPTFRLVSAKNDMIICWWRLQHMLSIVSIYDWQYILQSNDVHSGIGYQWSFVLTSLKFFNMFFGRCLPYNLI